MPITSTLKQVATRAVSKVTVHRREAALNRLLLQGLPTILIEPARYLLKSEARPEVQGVQERVETQRRQIAASGCELVDVIYSPKPGSAGSKVTTGLRPEHGKVMSFTMERVARTGKDEKWGTFLHLLACNVEGTFLELGACAGISSAYLASAPSCKQLLTIEGSPALAQLARETTSSVAPGRVEVITGLFDDVLDKLLPDLENGGIDFAFIDGHHERVATLHYFERIKTALRPGAVVVFDDISWSADMRAMWDQVAQQDGILLAADFGAVGVIIYDPCSSAPVYWDFQPIVGRHGIGNPWGWKE